MVLKDALLMNQTGQSWVDCTNVKCLGANYLDAVTREIPTLEHFVTFSSVSAGHGNAGQTNYAFGNTTMDEVVRVRREHGFPGLSMQWGIIGDVGYLAEKAKVETTLPLLPQPIVNCLEVLETAMARTTSIPCIIVSYVSRAIEAYKAGVSLGAKARTAAPAAAAAAPARLTAPAPAPKTATVDEALQQEEKSLSRAMARTMSIVPARNVVSRCHPTSWQGPLLQSGFKVYGRGAALRRARTLPVHLAP